MANKYIAYHTKGGPLNRFLYASTVTPFGAYGRAKDFGGSVMSHISRLKFFPGIGWLCDYWDGTQGWKAPEAYGAYHDDSGRVTYIPQR